MPKRLLSDKQVAFIEDGAEAVDPKNIWNYEQRIRENLDEGLSQIFRLFPDLLPYLDEDRIQGEIDAGEVGMAFGQLLTPAQRREVAAMLLWGEQRPDESDGEFLARVPDIVDEYEAEFTRSIGRIRHSGESVRFLRSFADRIETKFTRYIQDQREEAGISFAIPRKRVIEWASTRGEDADAPSIRSLLDELYGPWDDGIDAKILACRDILLSLGMRRDVEGVRPDATDVEDRWQLHLPPTETDRDQYLAVIDALDDDIRELVEAYFEEEDIELKDRLLARAFDELDGVSRPAKDILEWDELSDTRPEWKGHHTRIANLWTDEREIPLLTLGTESRNRREWKRTAFGEVVKWLWEHNIDRSQVEQGGIPADLDDLLRDAIAVERG